MLGSNSGPERLFHVPHALRLAGSESDVSLRTTLGDLGGAAFFSRDQPADRADPSTSGRASIGHQGLRDDSRWHSAIREKNQRDRIRARLAWQALTTSSKPAEGGPVLLGSCRPVQPGPAEVVDRVPEADGKNKRPGKNNHHSIVVEQEAPRGTSSANRASESGVNLSSGSLKGITESHWSDAGLQGPCGGGDAELCPDLQ
mmetsp:Transcript_18097/g.38681  ORF Transcript_18097/g.38681 Transcript_18097/m.38681 type:complete len:201 (-) Transcript_18097:1207-1809(-)